METLLSPASNEIWYTNGNTSTPSYPYSIYGIVSNKYDESKGCWVIKLEYDLTEIRYEGFFTCQDFISIILPNSVKSIQESAFQCCTFLESIFIPDSVIEIGECAFCDCISLREVRISNNLKKLGQEAFRNCRDLISIVLPQYFVKNLTII